LTPSRSYVKQKTMVGRLQEARMKSWKTAARGGGKTTEGATENPRVEQPGKGRH